MTSLPNTVTSTGQVIINGGPPLHTGFTQNITGSALDAAANKTLAAQAAQVQQAKSLGAGQKGSSRRKRKSLRKKHRRMRGGVNLNANIPSVPEAGSISGVSNAQNNLDGVNNLNQIRADKVYDSLVNAPPRQVPSTGGKRSRKAKRNGRSHKRTHRRGNRKHASRNHRTRNVL